MQGEDKSSAVLFSAAAVWRDRCLAVDGSVLTDKQLWTLHNIRQLVRYFVENLDLSEGSFFSKLKEQLRPADPDAKKLAAEMLWVMYLVVHHSSMRPTTKRLQVEQVWGWSGESPPEAPHMLGDVLEAGVANPGTAFHTHRWRELLFFIRMMERWKGLPTERRSELLGDGWAFGGWMDAQKESKARQLRHALLFLLFPEDFEPAVTGQHKRAIVKRWYAETGRSLEDVDPSNRLAVDRALAEVRRHLEAQSPDRLVHFYSEPWASKWRERRDKAKEKQPDRAVDTADLDAWVRETFGEARVWAMAAGERARFWPEFQREGLIAMGMADLGDLGEYESKEEIKQALSRLGG
jgi:5-methylcytosine-specific restriction enzyme B